MAVAAQLGLRAHDAPAIPSPSGEKTHNQGFDAFLPLVDSGISAYVLSSSRFLSIFLYTCKGFDTGVAIDLARRSFVIQGEIASGSI
jgi:S-adenosylmethionine decarboxylase